MSDTETIHLVEEIPEHLLEQWRRGPLLLTRNFPVVELRGGVLTLRWGYEKIEAKIDECHFRVGRAWQMKFCSSKPRRLFLFGDADLILIDFPPLFRWFGRTRSYFTAPVGYTPESLENWNVALGNIMKDTKSN